MSNDFLNYNESSTWEKLKFSFKSWKYIGVGKSLLIWFLAISFIPLATVSYINYLNAYHGLTIVADKSLNSSSQLRLKYINTYFDGAIDILKVTASSHARLSVFETLDNDLNNSDLQLSQFIKTELWNTTTVKLRNEFDKLIKENDYYNFLFIDKDGNVLFSVKNEDVLGQNIFTGNLRTTILSETARKSLETGEILFSDLDYFDPSYNNISGFFIQPAINSNGQIIGLLTLQITVDGLNKMIQQEAGYGETGQAYLVGEDLVLRSATRFGEKSDILNKKVINEKTRDWKDYLLHRNDLDYLIDKELKDNKVSNYDSDGNGNYVMGIYRTIDELVPLGVNWALFEEIEHKEAFAYARRLSDMVKISFILTILVVFFISILVTRWFVNPIKQLSSWGKEVAIGKLASKSIKAPPNEIGDMRNTFNSLVTSLTSYANIARLMAKGDYSDNVEIRSKDDILGNSLNQMITSLKSVIEQANKIATGDYSTGIVPRSENDSLGKSLFSMTETLRNNALKIEQQDWLKTGINKLESTIKGKSDIEELSNNIISFFCSYLGAQLGLIYLVDNDELHLKSSYALKNEDKSRLSKLKTGEGAIGQSFKDQKRIIINDNSSNELPMFNYGAGEQKLTQFIIIPFVNSDNVIAIMELGMLNKLSENELRFLDTAANDIALSIITLQSHIKVLELLERTQEQANALEVQQEELRQTNEELQEQTNALKISEENLQSQKEELKVTNEELEERSKVLEVQRDAIKTKNKELEIARKDIELKARDLELASKYKSEFLANMSHELRTPLNSIIVLSQLMAENKKKHLDEKEQKFSQTINSSGIDLLNLINDILDLSKVESGKIELNIERLYFEDLKMFIESTFSEVMKEKGLELKIDIQKNAPESILSDIQRVHQVVKNLFSNAIKFTNNGEIKLEVSKPGKNTKFNNPELKSSSTIAISVIDTGIGIPDKKQKVIFEAFKQADGTTSRKYGGTGLGLSISRNFSQLLGGEMQLKSTEGEGSSFTLYLPYNLEISELNNNETIEESEIIDLDTKPVEIKSNSSYTDAITEKKSVAVMQTNRNIEDDINNLIEDDKVVLIIEDDYNFASVLYNLAHDHKFKAIIALDGESGLHLADYHMPKAIILDIGLPGMDGYEVMKRLKSNRNTRHIPVHFISAVDSNIKAFKMGAIGYLTKPVEKGQIDSLFDKIEHIISKPIKKLLIVEDEEIMRKSIINLMRGENIVITDVETGKEAFEKVSKEDYDCMILDLGLEDMTGFELLDLFEQNQVATNLPIIIYTGRELSRVENDKLKKYSQSIILKGARSFERLLAETTLFLHQVESKLPDKKKKMLEKVHGKGDVLEGKTILVVDDDMRNVFAISSLLESYNINVVVGKNGKDGIEKLKKNSEVNLILMDIMMPEMDGYEAMKLIRKDIKYQKLPIIALTAKAMKEDREKCIAAGANEYLSKPVEKDKLLSLLRVWLY
jgi:CheY-like chemotaxis protein/signal transduction histidine kinase/methyl-accepting chemotaxis protein